jgi:predicted neutral ceramidase superfamily lipid hydrolase
MRAANIAAGLAAVLWLALALAGRSLVNGVVEQRALGYPNIGQIDFMIVWPLVVVTGILACAWVCNVLRRWPWALGFVSATALVALVPYAMLWGGGV